MLTFLKKIRRSLIESGSARRYLLYATGEILLVMIGILLALQVNNWNEEKNLRSVEREYYKSILDVLSKDSIELDRIVDIQSKSIESLSLIINQSFKELNTAMSEEEFNRCLLRINNGNFSFFPKYGTYNNILSTTGLDIFKSEEVKSLLIDLYDYQFKRYENIDKIIDQKFGFDLIPFINKELGFSNQDWNIISRAKLNQKEGNYMDLVIRCRDMYGWLVASRDLLKDIQTSVNNLTHLIRIELYKK